MKNWKFVKTGNDSLITKDGRVNYPDKEIGEINILKRELEGLMRMAQSDKTHDYTKQIEALKKEISEKKNKYAVGNESIEKQEWSMFKGLSKDAEKEVGNFQGRPLSEDYKYEYKVVVTYPGGLADHEKIVYANSDEEAKQIALKYTDDRKSGQGNPKIVSKKQIGNANTVSEYNAEIQRLTKKAEQLRRMGQGRSAMEVEKQIEKLGKELRELGNKKTGNKIIDFRDPDPTGEVQASAMKRYYKLMDEYEKNKKKVEGIYKDKEGKKFRVYLYGPDSGYRSGNYSITSMSGEGIYSITTVVKELPRDFVKIGNARPKEQLLADVRELTKYIQEHNGQGCEKEKRLLGEAKEELDKNYGIIVGNFKTGKSKLSIGDKVSLYGVKGTVKSISGENGDNIYGEPVIEFESEDGKTKQIPEHYLVKVGNTGHWNSSKTMYAKWDDASGRPADEYAVITWLGEGKGGLVNIWKGHQMTSEKYGSYDLSDLRRWAEQRIGNNQTYINGEWKDTKSPKEQLIEYAKKSNDPEYLEHVKKMTNPNDINARLQWHKKSGNETLAEYAKSKPRVINGLSRARNAMTKNAMGIADLEAQIKKNEEYIKSLQGKTVDSEGWSAKASIQEAQDEIDRMKSRIEELKKQGNKKG